MMNKLPNASVLTLALLLCACATPLRQPAANDAMVAFIGEGNPYEVFAGTTRIRPLNEDANGERLFRVPSGVLVTLEARLSVISSSGRSACAPRIAFTPLANHKYFLATSISKDACFLQVVRQDDSVPTGVVREPSVRRASPTLD